MTKVPKLDPEHTVIFLCDIQGRLGHAIYGFDELVLVTNKVIKMAKILGIPVIVTEQNPKGNRYVTSLTPFTSRAHAGLGPTAPEIDLPALGDLHVATIEKSLFSMMVPEVKTLLRERPRITSVVLFGIESHICVLQTALDLLQEGYDVFVLADGVSSCNKEEVPIALAHIRQVGGHVITSESASFQLQREAGTPRFKAFSTLIKEELANTTKTSQKLLQYPWTIPRNMFGSLFHLAIDALLFSAFLAGIKRSTGLTPALSQVPNKDIRQMLRTYLGIGEYAFDLAMVVFGVILFFTCQLGPPADVSLVALQFL
ncbi:Isochorismatase-like protein [Chiua virens]|nr:Isochorismatase-like protein [Chiua virens]